MKDQGYFFCFPCYAYMTRDWGRMTALNQPREEGDVEHLKEAFLHVLGYGPNVLARSDHKSIDKAIKKFRNATLREARAAECARIVAWLNRQALFSYGEPFLKEAAAAIARGEHERGDPK